jgi:hypothetical protein
MKRVVVICRTEDSPNISSLIRTETYEKPNIPREYSSASSSLMRNSMIS